MNTITLNCNAKINLALDVARRRADGYHDVELIFNEISLFDTVSVSLRDDIEIHLSCDDTTLPCDDGNIAYRAAAAFFSAANLKLGADIELVKRIPHGAGLAGGSADAAGVLKALNKLAGEPLSADALMKLGVTLGADVPFCIMGGCALAEGIGDILTPLPTPPRLYYVIAKPDESVSTAWVYQNLDLKNKNNNICVGAVADGIRRGDLDMIITNSGNILESVTAKRFPIINDIKDCFTENGAVLSLMSGSGTSVFGAFKSEELASVAAEAVKKYTDMVYIV